MKKVPYEMALSILLLLSGCSGHRTPPQMAQAKKIDKKIIQKDPHYFLREFCLQDHQQFDEHEKQCICSSKDQQFTYDAQSGKGNCQPIVVKNVDNHENYLKLENPSNRDLNFIVHEAKSPQELQEVKEFVARAIFYYSGKLNNVQHHLVFPNRPLTAKELNEDLTLREPSFVSTDFNQRFFLSYFINSPEEKPAPFLDDLIKGSKKAKFKSEKNDFYTDLGAVDYLYNTKVKEDEHYTYSEKTLFLDGKIFKKLLYVQEKNHGGEHFEQTAWIVVFTPKDLKPNFYVKQLISPQEISYQAYSLRGEVQSENSIILQQTEKMLQFSQEHSHSIIFCDTALAIDDFQYHPTFSSLIHQGPERTSFFGWKAPFATGMNDNLDSDLPLPVSLQYLLPGTLGFHILATIEGAQNPSFIPVDRSLCFSFIRDNKIELKKSKIMVVNGFFGFEKSLIACQNDPTPTKVVDENKNDFLWIIDAGVGSKTFLPGEEIHLCPESLLTGKDNVIIVSSKNPESNKGIQYIDIIVDAPSNIEATATISKEVNSIHKKYPDLTPKEIKTLILKSVDLKERYPSRSQGVFSVKKLWQLVEEKYGVQL